MKKIILLTTFVILLFNNNACTGYKPIYNSSNFNIKIENYSVKGNKRLATLIYTKLYNISLSNKNNMDVRSINLSIETNKEKKSTVKNSAGKILEYEININTKIIIDNYLTEKRILDQNFDYSTSYKVQDEHSETIKLENKNIENLLNKTYEDVLIKISEVMTTQ